MQLIKIFYLFKKCLGEARWSNYKNWSDKYSIFKTLFRLRYLVEIRSVNAVVNQVIFEFKISGKPFELLYLFRETFLKNQYKFTHPNNEPRIIDAGANIGMAICYFKHIYPNCSILAFEPNPTVFEMLDHNVSRNRWSNVKIINKALSNADGVVDFYTYSDNSMLSSVDITRGGDKKTAVTCEKLSNYLSQQDFDFGKIDVEGSEWQILDDLNNTHTLSNIKQYIVEYHHNVTNSKNALSSFLKIYESHGYVYNISASYNQIGDFQDLIIHFFQPG